LARKQKLEQGFRCLRLIGELIPGHTDDKGKGKWGAVYLMVTYRLPFPREPRGLPPHLQYTEKPCYTETHGKEKRGIYLSAHLLQFPRGQGNKPQHTLLIDHLDPYSCSGSHVPRSHILWHKVISKFKKR
jgi:hypothetical protein